MELSQIHNCELCRGKIVCIELDMFGNMKCGYCHEIVNGYKSTQQISQLQNKLMLLGFSGMAYTEYWNEVAKELNELKELEDSNEKM